MELQILLKHFIWWQKLSSGAERSAAPQTFYKPSKATVGGKIRVSINGNTFIKLQADGWSLPYIVSSIVQLRLLKGFFAVFLATHTPLNRVCFGLLTLLNNRRGNHARLFSITGVLSRSSTQLYRFGVL